MVAYLIQINALREMLLHVSAGLLNLLPALWDTALKGLSVSPDKKRYQEQQRFLLLEASDSPHDHLVQRTQTNPRFPITDNIGSSYIMDVRALYPPCSVSAIF